LCLAVFFAKPDRPVLDTTLATVASCKKTQMSGIMTEIVNWLWGGLVVVIFMHYDE